MLIIIRDANVTQTPISFGNVPRLPKTRRYIRQSPVSALSPPLVKTSAWMDFEREHALPEPHNGSDEASAEVFFKYPHKSRDIVPLARGHDDYDQGALLVYFKLQQLAFQTFQLFKFFRSREFVLIFNGLRPNKNCYCFMTPLSGKGVIEWCSS